MVFAKNGVAFDQNTSDYTPNIAGCVGERIKNVRQIDILTRSSSSVYNAFTYTPSEKKLVRDTGNWMTEGFGIGDTVQIYYTDNVGVVHGPYNGTISAMNETTLIFSADPGMPASAFTIMTCTVTTALTALVYKFGLVDNDASFSAESLMTGSEQVYYAGSIGSGSPRSTGWVNMTALVS